MKILQRPNPRKLSWTQDYTKINLICFSRKYNKIVKAQWTLTCSPCEPLYVVGLFSGCLNEAKKLELRDGLDEPSTVSRVKVVTCSFKGQRVPIIRWTWKNKFIFQFLGHQNEDLWLGGPFETHVELTLGKIYLFTKNTMIILTKKCLPINTNLKITRILQLVICFLLFLWWHFSRLFSFWRL